MHLLNTLPQRLDPGATPTFAGLVAPSLTSPAGNNLTLGLGTGGTALTLTSSTLAATFAGVVVVPDGSAAAPSLVVSSSPTTGFYRHGSGAIGFSSAGLASAAFSSNSPGGGLYLEAFGTNQNIRVVPSGTGVFTTASPVTFTNSTAGSSGAGALVVTGGLATGGASYFGGAVTIAGTGVTATNASGSVEFSGSRSSSALGVTVTYKTGATTNWFHGLRGLVSNNWYLFNDGTGTNTLIFDYANNSATFAGTVIAPAATASLAPLRIPHGDAPTSPTNGDMWTTTAGLYIRINGATVGPLS
jgi:hypothetical protein